MSLAKSIYKYTHELDRFIVSVTAMKWCFLVCVAVVAVVVEGSPINGSKWAGYHESVGIPLAARLKKIEQETNMTRITGGQSVPLGTHPFMVSLF